MARRCGCASETCSCTVVAGDGIDVAGSGSPTNPYVVTSTLTELDTGIDVQQNNAGIALDVHQLDFRGTGVTVTPGVDEAIVTITVPDPISGAIIPTGAIWMFGMNVAPAGWLLCNGATVLISSQPNLFAAIGVNYGGDGVTNFMLPNLTDRFPIGYSGTKPITGGVGGSATKSIAVANLPPHNHSIAHNHPVVNTSSTGGHNHSVNRRETTGGANDAAARGGGSAVSDINTGSVGNHAHTVDIPNWTGTTSTTDGALNTPLDVMPPWSPVAFMIKT